MSDSNLYFEEIPSIVSSFRKATQQVKIRDLGGLRITANGTLKNRNRPSLKKYDTTITFSDLYAPALDRMHQGDVLTVHCIFELSGDVGKTFGRPHVPGSVVWLDEDGDVVAHGSDETVAPAGAVTYRYRPILTTMIDSFDFEEAEWDALVSGSLNLKEV